MGGVPELPVRVPARLASGATLEELDSKICLLVGTCNYVTGASLDLGDIA